MFLALALAFALAGWLHGVLVPAHRRDRSKRWELSLVWLTVGYFGIVMLAVALFVLAAPDRVAPMLHADPDDVFLPFTGVLYLSMAVIAVLAAFLRGRYLVGPVVAWSLFVLGATLVHLIQYQHGGHLGLHLGMVIIAEHTLPALLAIGLALRLLAVSRGGARPRDDA
jgi:hypothetical protein